jgi:hypothetical protein
VLKPAIVSARATRVATRVREYIYQIAQINDDALKQTEKQSVVTNPYRPEVGAATPNNIPFIVKSGEEFPAGRGLYRLSVV